MVNERGLIHIYTGKGKGKTTAALGLAIRAAGWGMKVCVFQFMKKGINGEYKASKFLGGRLNIVTFDQVHPCFYHESVRRAAREKLKKRISQDLKRAKEAILIGNYDIIIMDEVVNAVSEKFIKKKDILSVLNLKFRTSELILTGRGAPQWLINLADYATEMRLIKHPYDKGLKARKGIEF